MHRKGLKLSQDRGINSTLSMSIKYLQKSKSNNFVFYLQLQKRGNHHRKTNKSSANFSLVGFLLFLVGDKLVPIFTFSSNFNHSFLLSHCSTISIQLPTILRLFVFISPYINNSNSNCFRGFFWVLLIYIFVNGHAD